MTTNTPLTDATIEAALARCAERISGDGLQDRIMAGVARTSQSRPPLAARLGWLTWPAPSRRLAWVVAIAGLLLALLGGSLLVGSRFMESPPRQLVDSLPRHPAALVPTGLDTPALESRTIGEAEADGSGTVWAQVVRPYEVNGTPIVDALIRIDPSGAVRTWTVADDAAFGSFGSMVLARGGGVWLVPSAESGDHALRWFDGERFRDVVPAPPVEGPPGGPDPLAEAPDGSLWSGGATGLFRWDGTSWSAAPEGRPVAGVASLAVDRSGAVWVGNCDDDAAGTCRGISRFDGTRWETFASVDASGWIGEAPDGSIWVAGHGEFERYDGQAWTRLGGDLPFQPSRVHVLMSSWSADGTAWATQCAYFALDNLIFRYDGRAWVRYTSAGLPPRSITCKPIVPTEHGVYVGTGDGLYRLAGDRWERAWPQP
jgi:hypothetical protein